VIPKPGKRDRTSVKSYRCISLLPTIAKLVKKAITLYLSIQGELKGWWHSGQHGSRAGKNTTDALLWLIRKVRENRNKKKHTALVMVDVAAAFPNTSRSEIQHTLRNADPNIAHWIEQCWKIGIYQCNWTAIKDGYVMLEAASLKAHHYRLCFLVSRVVGF
jgi:hypothetical protein